MHAWRNFTVLLLAAIVLGGCQRSVVEQPLNTSYAANDAQADAAFWIGMGDHPLVSNDEAFHGLIQFNNGSDPTARYVDRTKWLKDQGFLDEGFDRPANEAVEVGTVAQILARMLEIEGGLTMRLLGAHPRYATRELVYLRLLPNRTPQQGLMGVDFLGIIARAETYQSGVPK